MCIFGKTKKMKVYKYIAVIASALVLGVSCKDKDKDNGNGLTPDEDKVRVQIKTLYNGEPLDFNSIYLTEEGYRIQFSKVNLIMTDFHNDGEELFKSAVYRFENSNILHEGPGDYTKFSKLSGRHGVSEEENHSDPAARDLTDPLNIMHVSDMHWGWNSGYIFAMIEGRIDTTGTEGAPLNVIWSYHTGKTFLNQYIEFEEVNWTKVNDLMHETIWYLDAEKIFDGEHRIDIKSKLSSHTNPSEEAFSQRIAENIKYALRAN